MKIFKKLLLFGIILAFLLTSCSIEKRHYLSGYNVDWKVVKRIENKQEPVITSFKEKKELRTDNRISQREDFNMKSEKNAEAPLTLTVANSYSKAVSPQGAGVESKINKGFARNIAARIAENTNPASQGEKIKNTKKEKAAVGGSGKSQIVALVLCIFLVLYLFTFVLFGIGWLIDIVLLIIPNGLTPKGQTNYKG